MFTATFYFSWLLFGFIYFIISYIHGDFSEENLLNTDWNPCIQAVDGFSAVFLFSLETQHTIGYGTRMPTTECPDAQLVVSFQVRIYKCFVHLHMLYYNIFRLYLAV